MDLWIPASSAPNSSFSVIGKINPQYTEHIVTDGEFEFSVRIIAKNLNIFCGQNEGLLKEHGSYSNQCALMDYYFFFCLFPALILASGK